MVSQTNASEKKLVVCYDAGSSLSKILYSVDSGDVKYMVMEPEHLALPSSSASSLPVDAGMGKPEDNAWVKLNKNGSAHAVGRVARDYRASVSFKTLKWETATPKILAAVGAIAEREKLEDKFSLDLGMLLPYGEIRSADGLSKELKTALQSFYFRHKRLKVALERYQCLPEASGSAMLAGRANGDFSLLNQAYLMFGHRNTSVLFFRRGSFSRSESSTTNLGFYDLIDKMREKVPVLERDDVLRAIQSAAGERVYLDNDDCLGASQAGSSEIVWSAIAKSHDSKRAAQEVSELKKAYAASLAEYWLLLSNWLNEALPQRTEIDAVVRCGGAAEILEHKICEYFQGIPVQLSFGSEQKELLKALKMNLPSQRKDSDFIKQNLAVRFADVWGLFAIFSGYKQIQGEAA